ncbi:MAG: hypothetical protein FJZ80_05750 [Bacteroidetes bacterium]|nr:hypothetical protein [Bacteroidota bacterium]MBM3424574.1 hypothetical protein [Bacteroidota bacterium]
MGDACLGFRGIFRCFLILASSVCYCGLHAQVLKVYCLDYKTLEPVSNVTIYFQNGDSIMVFHSDRNGSVSGLLNFESGTNELSISAQHPMYEPQNYRKIFLQRPQNFTEIKILLKSIKQKNIDPIVVKAPGIPDTVFNSTEFHVSDFEISEKGDYVLLVYPKRNGQRNSILLCDAFTIKDTISLNGIGIEMTRDYRNNIHVVCQESIFRVDYQGDSLKLWAIPKNYFLDYLMPIIDSTSAKFFFSNFNNDYPAFDYFAWDLTDSTYRKIIHIEDSLMMELYRSELKWADVRTRLWAKRQEIETGLDAAIWTGANYFTQSIYYQVPYAPLFKVGDSIYVFDFPSDKMWVYNESGDPIRSTGLYLHYHKEQNGWKRKILQDAATGALYAVFEKDGITYLGRIDVMNGQIFAKHRIHHKYVENIRINRGFAYYIYRPFESFQKRFLYKERLFN